MGILFAITSLACTLAPFALSQSSDHAQAASHGSWRLEPQPLKTSPVQNEQDGVLLARGRYSDALMPGTGVPLDQPQRVQEGGYSVGFAIEDELTFFPPKFRSREAILVASFESSDVHLSPSRLSIYTTVHLYVEQVLDAGDSHVSSGHTIDLVIAGGKGTLSDGRVLSGGLRAEALEFSIQPGHRYLFFLDYEKDGNFFVNQKDWEFKNGIAVPDRLDEVVRAREGRARYSGLSERAFIRAVEKAIEANKQGGTS